MRRAAETTGAKVGACLACRRTLGQPIGMVARDEGAKGDLLLSCCPGGTSQPLPCYCSTQRWCGFERLNFHAALNAQACALSCSSQGLHFWWCGEWVVAGVLQSEWYLVKL